MIENQLQLTAANLKEHLLFGEKKTNIKMQIPIFRDHNNRVKALIGKEFTKGTYDRYTTSLKHKQDFLLWKYGFSDIDIKQIDHDFVASYDLYLRSERNCNNNLRVKYLKNFKKIILSCIANRWIDKDLFAKHKMKVKEVQRDYLNTEELQVLATKTLVNNRISLVRDIFLFSCYMV
ncbi:phage integrase SAM-like domain-containing protein [Mucilaginibacter aquaedulcis]|uniref:phage integrase SAM-like domain-containing protein n=1 Tax=Mucilaginibacter aquaedulcis TaxID=1187081 RepID=UPI0025B4FE45|nr:phage integrase SAM-like domain-containing protein [Mucilaginibacter aquaedulcis]MDN3548346.1 phage integrase SAM-like domain-containing protein [Mucilaginibacter aquaedulcis]